jgi:hypothetical protein
MKLSQTQEETLLNYIDGTLSASEREKLEELMKSTPAIAARLTELRTLDESLRTVKLEQPSKNFTQMVMGKLDQYPSQSRSFSSFNGILLLAGVLVAIGIGALLVSAGVFDTPGSIDLNQTIGPNKYIQKPLPSIPFNGKLIVNIIILLNLALAFLVLDRAVLKPWFEKRAKMHGMT